MKVFHLCQEENESSFRLAFDDNVWYASLSNRSLDGCEPVGFELAGGQDITDLKVRLGHRTANILCSQHCRGHSLRPQTSLNALLQRCQSCVKCSDCARDEIEASTCLLANNTCVPAPPDQDAEHPSQASPFWLWDCLVLLLAGITLMLALGDHFLSLARINLILAALAAIWIYGVSLHAHLASTDLSRFGLLSELVGYHVFVACMALDDAYAAAASSDPSTAGRPRAKCGLLVLNYALAATLAAAHVWLADWELLEEPTEYAVPRGGGWLLAGQLLAAAASSLLASWLDWKRLARPVKTITKSVSKAALLAFTVHGWTSMEKTNRASNLISYMAVLLSICSDWADKLALGCSWRALPLAVSAPRSARRDAREELPPSSREMPSMSLSESHLASC